MRKWPSIQKSIQTLINQPNPRFSMEIPWKNVIKILPLQCLVLPTVFQSTKFAVNPASYPPLVKRALRNAQISSYLDACGVSIVPNSRTITVRTSSCLSSLHGASLKPSFIARYHRLHLQPSVSTPPHKQTLNP